jgi:prepilin-type N-terminal cleavage/methylation domain-containing protein
MNNAARGFRGPRGLRARRDRGMTVVEIMIALVVISIALVSMISLMMSGNRLQEDARERGYAYNAARAVLENMRSTDFATVFDTYKKGASLNTFKVDRLSPITSGAQQGTVEFPEKNGLLDESYSDTGLGTPKDLNQDGDSVDLLAGNAVKILPVRVTVRWLSPGGRENKIEIASFITEK